jgi:hypothetical protein
MKFTLGKATGLGIRILAGLALGVLAGSLIWHRGMGIVFLIALFGGTAFISLGLGPSRLLVAMAIWLGQYSIFYWRFVEPARSSVETAGPLFVIHNLFVFMPAIAVIVGAYVGLVGERIYRTPANSSPR